MSLSWRGKERQSVAGYLYRWMRLGRAALRRVEVVVEADMTESLEFE